MIKSMTGYGAAEGIGLSKRFTVEIKSVNHRYSDISVKTPRSYVYLEDVLRKSVAAFISRGKTDVFLTIENMEGVEGEVSLNSSLAKSYYNALSDLRETLGIPEEIKLEHMTRFTDIFNVQRSAEDAEEITKIVSQTAKEAAQAFTRMRAVEGEKLYADLEGGIALLESLVATAQKRSPQIVEEYRNRLYDKMKEIVENYPVDEGRLLNEVAVFADKVDVNEEVVRLKSHTVQMRTLLKSDEPVGRKLDFLIQEMNRETNTIGSKSNDLDVARLVIDMKSCIEKLREQIQNVE